MDNIEYEVSILRKIEESELREFIGNSIVSAVDKSYNTNIESILAELLILKCGEALLDDKKLRMSLIDLANEGDILDIYNRLNSIEVNYPRIEIKN